ncbi:MAG: tRNA adenosine(34) deaminase TadA [Candidatus Goldbacteria bacterium]|nr:tRNA adenosine(34) deaminase TadA [Candidatus Goldiibacteriota bacterium]
MQHIKFMKEAIKEAEKSFKKDEVPVGAVLVYENKIIATAHNLIRTKKDPAAHAEILAIRKAAKKLNNERLIDASLYVTIEPCAMCAGAIILARIKNLIFGAKDQKTGACGSVFDVISNKKNNHKVNVISGIMENECAEIMKKFFKNKRNRQ